MPSTIMHVLQPRSVLESGLSSATQKTCLCCLEDFQPSSQVAVLPCGHIFDEDGAALVSNDSLGIRWVWHQTPYWMPSEHACFCRKKVDRTRSKSTNPWLTSWLPRPTKWILQWFTMFASLAQASFTLMMQDCILAWSASKRKASRTCPTCRSNFTVLWCGALVILRDQPIFHLPQYSLPWWYEKSSLTAAVCLCSLSRYVMRINCTGSGQTWSVKIWAQSVGLSVGPLSLD